MRRFFVMVMVSGVRVRFTARCANTARLDAFKLGAAEVYELLSNGEEKKLSISRQL